MGKIKGWTKTLDLPYRVEYNKVDESYRKSIGLGDVGIIISREHQENNFSSRIIWKDTWQVTLRKYSGSGLGQQYKDLVNNLTKEDALQYAYSFMRKN